MEACPAREQLEFFVFKRLGHDDAVQLSAHVECCATCREAVASLSHVGPTKGWDEASEVVGDLRVPEALPEELRDHPRYRVEGMLGRGGMGTVYKAVHRLLDRPVVLKIIRSRDFVISIASIRHTEKGTQRSSISIISRRNWHQ